jgi:hypothetical protein
MSYKDEMKKKIYNILEDGEPNKTLLYTHIKNLYEKALYESKITGQSIESITYEILEGLEEYYKVQPQETEEILNHCSTIMINIVHETALKTLENKNKKIIQAKIQLIETLEVEKTHLWETLLTFKNYAQDNSHSHFKKSLHQTESDIIDKICILSDYIK